MIVIASHVGSIRPSDDCQLYRFLMPADWQAGLMPHSSYGVCGWLHLFMHPIFQLGDALAIIDLPALFVHLQPETFNIYF